jgi:hypothetical protein
MALTYQDTSDLMKDVVFRGRVTVACTKFARYITDEQPNVAGHPTRYKWAQQTLIAPEVAANLVIPTVVWDVTVQAEGTEISDAALQTAVEAAVQKLM